MKKIITIISLFSSVFTFGQCVNLYVKEHFSGDPICQLYPGATLEVCLDNKTVRGGSCDFYIIAVRDNYDGMSIDLALDNVYWAPKYAELKINTKYKNFGFIIGNRSGAYSYSNESEMSSQREQGEIARENYKKALEKEKIESDQKLTTAINLAISKKEYFKANQLYNNLNKANSALFNEINTNLTPVKSKMDLLYSKYLSDFNLTKKEYYKNNKDFILKNKENISISSISLDGKEAYLERIKNTTNQGDKKNREEILETISYVYQNLKGQHYIAAVGVASNFYEGLYDSKNIDELQLALNYDTLSKSYYSCLDFLQKDKRIVSGIIVNKNNYKVKKYSMPYPMQLKDLLNVAINQGSNKFVEENYPTLTIPLDYIESIPFNSLKKSSNPGEGIKNNQYEELKKKFEILNSDIKTFASDKLEIITDNFYNPSLIYLIKKMYPNADSLIFVLGDNTILLSDLAIHIPYAADERGNQRAFGSIVPLEKGVIELKNNKLIIYKENGNYLESDLINMIDKSIISLRDINLENLVQNPDFYKKYQNNRLNLTICPDQYPLKYTQFLLRKSNVNFLYSDSTYIQLMATQNTSELYGSGGSYQHDKPYSFIWGEDELYFNAYIERNNIWGKGEGFSSDIDYANKERELLNTNLRNYIININQYFEYKKEGNINKANKSKLKADQYIEKFKTLYLNKKYYY